MDTISRTRTTPHHVNLENILTPTQLITLQIAEDNGWELYFVKQEGLEPPVAGIKDSDSHTIGIIDENGNFKQNPVTISGTTPELSGLRYG